MLGNNNNNKYNMTGFTNVLIAVSHSLSFNGGIIKNGDQSNF